MARIDAINSDGKIPYKPSSTKHRNRKYKSGSAADLRVLLSVIGWILTYFATLGLAVASLATECWIVWKEEVTQSEHTYGLFLSRAAGGFKPCELQEVVRKTGKKLFREFDLQSMIVLMFLGVGLDTLCAAAGMLYFFAKGKAKTNLWKRSIPTVMTGLIASGFVLLTCLIFIVDLEDVSATQVLAHVDDRCTTNLEDVNLSPETGYSFFLALGSGTVLLIKSAAFGILVMCF